MNQFTLIVRWIGDQLYGLAISLRGAPRDDDQENSPEGTPGR